MSELKTDAIDYAMRFMSNAPRIWSNTSIEHQIIYQRLVFPEGLEYDLTTNKFRTPKLSTLYTLANMKKDAEASISDTMVNHLKSNWNHILEEINQWYEVLRGTLAVAHIPAGSSS